MKMITAFACMMLTSCAWAKPNVKLDLHGIQVAEGKLRILVTSTGCTSKTSFKMHWQKNSLNILRIASDNCRRMPHRIWVELDLPENKRQFTLTNNITI